MFDIHAVREREVSRVANIRRGTYTFLTRFFISEVANMCFNCRRSCSVNLFADLYFGKIVPAVKTEYLIMRIPGLERRAVDSEPGVLHKMAKTMAAGGKRSVRKCTSLSLNSRFFPASETPRRKRLENAGDEIYINARNRADILRKISGINISIGSSPCLVFSIPLRRKLVSHHRLRARRGGTSKVGANN